MVQSEININSINQLEILMLIIKDHLIIIKVQLISTKLEKKKVKASILYVKYRQKIFINGFELKYSKEKRIIKVKAI